MRPQAQLRQMLPTTGNSQSWITPCAIQIRPSGVTVSVTLPRLLFGAEAPTAWSPGATAVQGADQLAPSLAPREQRMRTLTSSSCAPEYQQTSNAPDGSSAIAAPWFSPTAGAGSSARKIEGAPNAATGASQLNSSAKAQA